MDALVALADGDEGVRRVGVAEYVNQFFDVIDDDALWHWREWSCLTTQEVGALDRVQQVLREASEATAQMVTDGEFIGAGWPTRVRPAAVEALSLMQERGRFREDAEEEIPSGA